MILKIKIEECDVGVMISSDGMEGEPSELEQLVIRDAIDSLKNLYGPEKQMRHIAYREAQIANLEIMQLVAESGDPELTKKAIDILNGKESTKEIGEMFETINGMRKMMSDAGLC